MFKLRSGKGFTLVEVLVGVVVFMIFALGIYGSLQMVLKTIYRSRITIIQTALLDERLEIARNLPFDAVGIVDGLPVGLLPHTTTTVRNGITFLITTAVRNVDDPFDGVLGGIPNDTAPADYKLVEISVQCGSCERPMLLDVSTIIPPKDLEGSSENGAIFIYVSDSHSNPVAGADVHIVNTSTARNIIIDDVTDKDGYLRIVDTPTGTQSYSITVSKPGYSSDYTVVSSAANPDPTNRPITVAMQQISEVYFSIDKTSSLTVHAMDETCNLLPAQQFTMSGSKLVGAPNIKKYSENLQTDEAGSLDINNLEFDTYAFSQFNGYDLAGSIPMTPLELVADSHNDVTLVLSPHVANSLLVKVIDNSNNLPLSDATVVLKKSGYYGTQKTNYGNISQTDWSGGSGAIYFTTSTSSRYESSSLVDTYSAPGNITLTKIASQYVDGGMLDSSIFNIGKPVELKNIIFTSESLPVETGDDSVLLQLAVSNSSTPADLSNFVGPDGTTNTFYSSTNTIIYTGGEQYQYFRYRLFLSTNDQNFTPVFSGLGITFTNGCAAPGQVFFSNLSSGMYELGVSATNYNIATTSIYISGQASSTVVLYKSI